MSIYFGKVSKYFSDRGFGFVSRLLGGTGTEVFFHIKTIMKTNPELAANLTKGSVLGDVYFWFDTTMTKKGIEVQTVLTSTAMREGAIGDVAVHIKEVEALWRNVYYQNSMWLDEVTFDLVGRDRAAELKAERKLLEAEWQRAQEDEAQRVIDWLTGEYDKFQTGFNKRLIERIEAKMPYKTAQEEIEDKEFQCLVTEFKPLGFTHSSQVSNYIVSNRLGYKYPNISGVLQMELDGTIWDFKGGFPPKIYAKLCEELDLTNHGSKAKAIKFESFGSIEEHANRKQ